MSETYLTDTPFTDFDLPESLLKGIREAGFSHCTRIQAETLPLALAGRDVAGQAQTGTGKSAAFLLATFARLLKNPPMEGRGETDPRAMILAPTRELAIQIHKDAEQLGKYTGLKLGLVYGGTGYDSQRKTLEDGVDILIGTPGRLIDYFKQHIFRLTSAEVMVLDEADRMFDLGFIKDIRYLFRHMPPADQRLNLLFSATLAQRVLELAYEHMNDATKINVAPDTKTADKVSQVVYHTANDEKIPLLIGLLRHMDPTRTLVFANTKRDVERVQAWLDANGIHAAVISGDVPQTKRQRLLQDFSEGKLPVLVATDVAARGLHIPEVSHVFNYDIPQDAEDYVHRIGRTARAGASGDAISFACESYAFHLMDVEEYIGHKIPVGAITEELTASDLERPRRIERQGRPRDGRGGGRGRDGGRSNGGRGRSEGRSSSRGGRSEGRRDERAPRGRRAEGDKPQESGERNDRGQSPQRSRPQDDSADNRPDTPVSPSAGAGKRPTGKGSSGPAIG